MARPVRINLPNDYHHVTSRGNEKKAIFRCNADRERFLAYLAEAVRRYDWRVTAWVQMTNHFHLVINTPSATLSAGMQWFLGAYSQWFNKKYDRSGHLFAARFHSILIDSETYLTRVVRYVMRNPIRARMVKRPELYRWSSCRATLGLDEAPAWLALEKLAPFFGDAEHWQSNCAAFVAERKASRDNPWADVRNGVFLGSEVWIQKVRRVMESKPRCSDYPATQRAVGRPHMPRVIATVARIAKVSRKEIQETRGGPLRMLCAWLGRYEGWHRLSLIAASLRIRSSGRISDLIDECEQRLGTDARLREILDLALPPLRV